MATTWPDVNGGHRLHRDFLPIEFDMTGALKDEINFGHALVIMRAGILLDINDVQAGDTSAYLGKGSAGETAGTALGWKFIQLGDFEVSH